MQSLTSEHAAITPGHALRIAEERKLAAHGEECLLEGVNFIPLVLESLGGLGPGPHRQCEIHWPSAVTATWIPLLGGYPPSGANNVDFPLQRKCHPWTTRQHSYPASLDSIPCLCFVNVDHFLGLFILFIYVKNKICYVQKYLHGQTLSASLMQHCSTGPLFIILKQARLLLHPYFRV